MQIDSSGSVASLIQGAKEGGKPQQQTAGGNTQHTTTTTGKSDMVTLTDAAAQLHRLEQAIASHPVVNTQRVEQVQQVVSDGGFKTDPAQLATKILSFESALNSARGGA